MRILHSRLLLLFLEINLLHWLNLDLVMVAIVDINADCRSIFLVNDFFILSEPGTRLLLAKTLD